MSYYDAPPKALPTVQQMLLEGRDPVIGSADELAELIAARALELRVSPTAFVSDIATTAGRLIRQQAPA